MKRSVLMCISLCLLQALFAQNAPVAVTDSVLVHKGQPTVLHVTANDDLGTGVMVTLLTATHHGTDSIINGKDVWYAPVQGYLGTDSFTYLVCDSSGLCDTGFVFIQLTDTNRAPVATDDQYSFADSISTGELDLLGNDTDPENDSLHIAAIFSIDANSGLGNVGVDPLTGKAIFTRNDAECGDQYFEYLLCDYQKCDTGRVVISFACPNDVFLPQGFSPNGDGKNDLLVFAKLENFTPAWLRVYNRYGAVVYENSDYQNDWDGTGLDSHKALPDGTYFYILQLSDKHSYRSYLVINR